MKYKLYFTHSSVYIQIHTVQYFFFFKYKYLNFIIIIFFNVLICVYLYIHNYTQYTHIVCKQTKYF